MQTSTNNLQEASSVRLSEHFLLSDLLGCSSVYQNGYPNPAPTGGKLREGAALCKNILEPLLYRSRLSVSYGYISPGLSQQIVKYQNPDKPSYHRWDSGAAADVVLHESQRPPILDAFWLDENTPASRLISYSESPFLCVASRAEEIDRGDPRRALYENRFMGVRKGKPKYIPYGSGVTRTVQKTEAREWLSREDWRGAGYPTYHGGGVKQLHHHRTSEFTVLTDWLYSDEAVREGYPNIPEFLELSEFRAAGAIYDAILKAISIRRMSIVRGFESSSWSGSVHTWSKGIYFVVIPPASVNPEAVAEAARGVAGVRSALVRRGRRVAIAAEAHNG